jgi:hypothetical protein
MYHHKASITRRLQQLLHLSDRSLHAGDAKASLIRITTRTAEITLHVNDDQRRL